MKAVVITRFGSPEVLQIQERTRPTPDRHEVLIEVKAAGINAPDTFQRKGQYDPPSGIVPDIPGLEISGTIVETGQEVKKTWLGKDVLALVGGGGYAEYCLANVGTLIPKPTNLSFIQAASLPETLYTVWNNVFILGGLKPNENFLIHGGAGGIGTAAIQLASLFGATVFTTVGDPEQGAYTLSLGAKRFINYKKEDFLEALTSESMDVILDFIGGDYFEKNISLLKPGGRLIYINAIKGADVNLNLWTLMKKRLTVTASTLRSRDDAFKAFLTQEITDKVLPLIETEKYQPQINKVFALSEAAAAHTLMEAGGVKGKIVLSIE